MLEAEEMTLGVAFERGQNGLTTQLYALQNLERAVKQRESNDISGRKSPFSESKATKMKERHQTWKEELFNLYRYIQELDAKLDEDIFNDLYAEEARSQRQKSSRVGSPLHELNRVSIPNRLYFQRSRQVPKLADEGPSKNHIILPTFVSSGLAETSILAPANPVPPIPVRHQSHRVSTRSSPAGGEINLLDIPENWSPSNLLAHEHIQKAKKRGYLPLQGGESQIPEITPPKTPGSSDRSVKLALTNSLPVLYEDAEATIRTNSTAPSPIAFVDTSSLRVSSRAQRPNQNDFHTPTRGSSLDIFLDTPLTPPDSGHRAHIPPPRPSHSGYFGDILERPSTPLPPSRSGFTSSQSRAGHPPSQSSAQSTLPTPPAAQHAELAPTQNRLAYVERLKTKLADAVMDLEGMQSADGMGRERPRMLDSHMERRMLNGMRGEDEEGGWQTSLRKRARTLLRGGSKRVTVTRL